MLKVVYPGTFDPFTRGHEDVVRRASRLFGEVIVGVAASESKGPLISAAERVAMAREVFAGFANVRVMGFSGLLMEFVRSVGASVGFRVRVPDGGNEPQPLPGSRNLVLDPG